MKHLKRWKLFESNKYESFIRDIKDLSLDLSDLEMRIKVWSEINTETDTPVPQSYKESIQVNIKEFTDGFLDIKEFIERSLIVLSDFSVKCFATSAFKVYQFDHKDIKDKNTVITNLGEYRDVDFYEIYIRFYKTEDVYHIVRYNIKPHRGGWSLADANIKTKEEANRISKDYIDIPQDHSLLVITDEEYWNAVGDEKYFRENKRTKPIEEGLKYSNESNQYKNYIYDDIREIFLELTDYKCDLYINKIDNKHVIILSNKNDIIDYFKLSDIKDELLRLKDYLGDKWIGCGIVFAGDPERIPVYINEDNYDDLDNFSEISNLSVIFNI